MDTLNTPFKHLSNVVLGEGKTHTAKKPEGTFYSDFIIEKGYLYAIFEHGSRVTYVKMCATEKTNRTKGFNVVENKNELIISIPK